MGYTVSGTTEIVKTYGDVLDQNWLVSNIRYIGFVGSDNAGSVTGYLVDSKGDRVPNTSVVTLSAIEWRRIWHSESGEALYGNPGAANYPVGNYKLDLKNDFSVNNTACHYEFNNYELIFPEALYNITIARKTLSLSPVSYSDGSAISTYYTGWLLDDIRFEYSGFISGEDEDTLNLPKITYNTAYCQSSNVGTVRLSSDFITNFADIANALNNYTLSFSGQATVRAIPIEVYLEKDGGLSALYRYDDSSRSRTTSFGPYTVGYKYKVVETEGTRRAQLVDGSMSIVSGVYGPEDFHFAVPADMYDALSRYGIDAAAINVDEIIGSIAKYGSGDFVPNVSTSPSDTELSGTEPLNYMDLYRHSYEVVEDTVIKDGEYYTTYRLTGMNFGTNNYTFSYRPFDVRMVIAVDAIYATISKYVDLTVNQIDEFITKDGEVTDEMRQEIDFMAISSYLVFQDANLVIYDNPAYENTARANNIIINIMNANAEAISGDMTYLFKLYYAINGALNEVSMNGTVHNSLSFAYDSADPTDFKLNDTRVLNYSSEDTYAILPVRFFETESKVTENPVFKIGGEGDELPYDKRVDAGTKQNYYTAATPYDIGYFEFSAELPADEGSAVIDILVNGTSFADPKALFIRFRAGLYNKIELIYGTGSDQQIIEYPINYGYIFDGRVHTVEFELQKAKNPYTSYYFTFVARIDGRSGAIVNLTSAINAIAAIVEEGSDEQVFAEADKGSAGIAFIADNFVLRRVVLTKKGRYDNSGVISTIRGNSDTVLITGGAIDPATDYSEFSSATLHELFGLRYLNDDSGNIIAPSGYTYQFYIDGTPFDIGANVSLACGRHRLEVGIYYDGILIDADELILTVVSMLTDGEISIIEFNDAGEVVTEESEAEFTGMQSIDLADYEADRVNGSLVIASNTGNAQAIVSYNSDTRINYVSAAFTVEPAAVRIDGNVSYPVRDYGTGTQHELNNYSVLFRMELFEISGNDSMKQVNFVLLYLQQNAARSLSGLTYSVIPALELVGDSETTRSLFNSGSDKKEDLPVYTGTDLPLFTVQAFVDKQPSDNYGTGNMVVQFSCNNENGVYSDIATLSPTFGTASPIDSMAVARLGLPIEGSTSNNTVTNIILNSDLGAQATMYDIGFGNDIPYTDTKYLSNSGNIYQQYEGTGDDPSTGNSDQPSYFLSDNGRSPTAYRHNGIAGKFSPDADFTIYLSSLYLNKNRGGDKGAYLKKSGNTLTFAYYYVVGQSDSDDKFVKEFFTGSQSITLTAATAYEFDLRYGTNLDGERDDNMIQRATENLYFANNLILSADTTNPVYYQTLTLTVNGEEYTFYCPLFEDGFAGWTLENAYGHDLHDLIEDAQRNPGDASLDPYRYITDVVNENYYGSMDPEAFYRLPTFISYIGYILVETQNIDGIELTPTLGIDYSESAAGITDSPRI